MLTWDESVQKAAEQYADTMLLLEVEREHVIQDFIEGVKWCKNQYTHKEDVELSPREMEMILLRCGYDKDKIEAMTDEEIVEFYHKGE